LAVWDRLRRQVAAEAGERCEIFGGRGRRWPVECHEVWDYDEEHNVQPFAARCHSPIAEYSR